MSLIKKVVYAIKTDKSIKDDKKLTPEEIAEILKKKKKFKKYGKEALIFAIGVGTILAGKSYFDNVYLPTHGVGGKRKSKKRSRKKSKKRSRKKSKKSK